MIDGEFGPNTVVLRGSLTPQAPLVERTVRVGFGAPVKATLVWVDPVGLPNTGGVDDPTPALVHDLDLTLVAPFDQAHFPWRLDRLAPGANAERDAANWLAAS